MRRGRGSSASNRACAAVTCWRAMTRSCASTSSGSRPSPRHGRSSAGGGPSSVGIRTRSMPLKRCSCCSRCRVDPADYPSTLDVEGNALPLHYRFDPYGPGRRRHARRALAAAARTRLRRLEWLIPGWLRAKVVAAARAAQGPAARDRADSRRRRATARGIAGVRRGLAVRAAGRLRHAGGRHAGRARASGCRALPPWLRINLRVLDDSGRPLREPRSRRVAPRTASAAGAGARPVRRPRAGSATACAQWDFGDLPAELIRRTRRALQLRAYPGMQDDGAGRPPAACSPPRRVRRATRPAWCAWRRWRATAARLVRRQLAADREFAAHRSERFRQGLLAEIADRAVANAVFGKRRAPTVVPRRSSRPSWMQGRARQSLIRWPISHAVRQGRAARLRRCAARSAPATAPAFAAGRASVLRQLGALLAPGWVRDTPAAGGQLPKYVKALPRGASSGCGDVERDQEAAGPGEPVRGAWRSLVAAAGQKAPTRSASACAG
jgi:hypothetical protein